MQKPDSQDVCFTALSEIAHPPEKVWRALSQPHLIQEWKNDFAPVVGLTGDWGSVDCEVLTLDLNKTLSYNWCAMGVTTIVTWTLTPQGSGLKPAIQGKSVTLRSGVSWRARYGPATIWLPNRRKRHYHRNRTPQAAAGIAGSRALIPRASHSLRPESRVAASCSTVARKPTESATVSAPSGVRLGPGFFPG